MEDNNNTNNQILDDNKFARLGNVAMVAFVLLVIYLFFWLAKTSGNVAYVAIGIGVIVIGALVYFYFSSLLPTDNRIISKLREAGYECGMEEGRIYFKKRENHWRIFISDVSKRYRKILFGLSFKDEDLDKDHALINRIVCIVGDRNYTVMINWNGKDGIRFLYATVFTSTKDILREFSLATEAIDTAANEFFSLKERLMDNMQPANEHKVGFHYGDNAETESKAQEIRAQSNENTTN